MEMERARVVSVIMLVRTVVYAIRECGKFPSTPKTRRKSFGSLALASS